MVRRMVRTILISLALMACSKKAPTEDNKPAAPAPAPVTAGTVAPDGIRHVPVAVSKDGYAPDKIAGKPGEKLVLVFTRTFDAECLSQVKMPDGKLVALPLNKPVEVAITVPQTGQVGFACGMGMFHGANVAQPGA